MWNKLANVKCFPPQTLKPVHVLVVIGHNFTASLRKTFFASAGMTRCDETALSPDYSLLFLMYNITKALWLLPPQ